MMPEETCNLKFYIVTDNNDELDLTDVELILLTWKTDLDTNTNINPRKF